MSINIWLSVTWVLFTTLWVLFVIATDMLGVSRGSASSLTKLASAFSVFFFIVAVVMLLVCVFVGVILDKDVTIKLSNAYNTSSYINDNVDSDIAREKVTALLNTDCDNYFDTVIIKHTPKALSFLDFIASWSGVFNGDDVVATTELEIKHNTSSASAIGKLTSVVASGKESYNLGDTVFNGVATNDILSSYLDKSIEVRVVYPSSNSVIKDYFVVSVNELS